jgi:hypothetical protein
MELLTIGFSKPRKFKIGSWLIRWSEKTSFSHIYIQWSSQFLEREIIYQASQSMVHFIEGKRFNEINQTLYKFDILLNSSTKKKVIQYAMDRAGVKYSYKQLLGLSIAKILNLLGFKASNPLKDGRSGYVCCELVAEVLIELGFVMPQDLDDITPKDVFDYLMGKQDEFTKQKL